MRAEIMTRDQLVKSLVEEYRKSGKDAAVKLFDQSIKRFEISQYGIKTIITEFRDAITKDDKVGRTASEYGNDEIRWPDGLQHY